MNTSKTFLRPTRAFLSVLFFCAFTLVKAQSDEISFSFGSNQATDGLTCNTLLPSTVSGVTYGLSGTVVKKNDYCTSDSYFAFWATRPEGNYLVKVVVGSDTETSNVTIKAESRRLMIYDHTTAMGSRDTLEFVVNIRKPAISTGGSISLKSREIPYLNWDNYLTLEFGGDNPCVRSLTIEKVDVPTIFLAGNSTVTDQETEPWASWGQLFPLFLKPNIAVANFAESGESLKSFEAENRLKKIESQIDSGDYMMMEFAHNDQKSGWTYVEPYTTYQEYLMKFANVAINHKATPVFVTSTNRRTFDSQGNITNSLGDYPAAMRQLGEQKGILMLDLNAMSKLFYEALGVEGSKKAFVHYPANYFPFQPDAWADNTHFNYYGAWQLAKAVVEKIRISDSPLREFLRDDVVAYDPSNPDTFASFKWPVNLDSKVSIGDPLTLMCEQELSSDATLAYIMVDGQKIEGFHPDTLQYTVEIPSGIATPTVVTAKAKDTRASVEISQAIEFNGKATITVTAEDGSQVIYEVFLAMLNPLNVEALDQKIYPNPTTGIIRMDKVLKVEIFNAEGKMVLQESTVGKSELDISFLTKGIYLIKMEKATGLEIGKLVKK